MLTVLLTTLFAGAQGVTEGGAVPTLNAQTFRPTIDGRRTLWTDDSARGPHNQGFGRLLFHYTDDPLVYVREDGEIDGLVTNVMQADVLAGYAYDRLRVGVDLPVYLLAAGNGQQETGLGDVSLEAKLTALDGEDAPINLGGTARLTLPTTTVATALGDPGVGWEVAGVVDRSFGPVLLAANLGLRGGPSTTLETIDQGPVEVNDSFLFRTAAGYEFIEDVGATAEITGRTTFASAYVSGTPVEWLLGGYGYAMDDLVIRGGFGSGLTSGVGSPDFRVVLGVGWEPRGPRAPKDTDLDGITDDIDQCVEEPEDIDEFEDDNGCPDPDNDADGIVDAADQCPLKPEDADGWEDDNGCPDPRTDITVAVEDADGNAIDLAKLTLIRDGEDVASGGQQLTKTTKPGVYTVAATAGTYMPGETTIEVVNGPPQSFVLALEKKKNVKIVVSRDRIDLEDSVNFETAKAVIKEESFDMLDQAVQILVDYPEIAKLRIEGHTDSRGSASYNLKLSTERAASVMQYFIDKGIDPERLTSEGFGEERPLDPAKTAEAYAKNRRVDFFIEEWDETKGSKTIEVAPE